MSTVLSSPTPKPVLHRRAKVLLSFIAVCLVCVIAMLTVSLWPAPPLQWVSQPLLAQPAAPSKFSQFKAKVLNFVSPLWRPLRRSRRSIQIGVTMRCLYADTPGAGGFGPPISTNSNGSRAWIFPDGRQHFDSGPDAISGSSPSLNIVDGSLSTIRWINASLSKTNDTRNLLIGLSPKIVGNFVRLDVTVASTDGSMSPPKTTYFSCRAQLPKTGSLAVDCPQALCADGKHFCFEFYSIVIDSTLNKPKR